MKKLIIFDYDGVIADSLNAVVNSVNSLGNIIGLNCNLKSEDFDYIDDMTYLEIMKKGGIPEDKLTFVAPLLFAEFIKIAENIKFFDGVSELLKKLSVSNYVAIISGNTKSVIENKFNKEGVLETVSLIYGADDQGNKADKIANAMEKFGCSKENTFMIGDSVSDIFFGKKAGVNTVAVTWGWQSSRKLDSMHPDYVAESIDELGQILK